MDLQEWVASRLGWALDMDGLDDGNHIVIGTVPTMTQWSIAATVTPAAVSRGVDISGYDIMSNDRGGWNDDVLFGIIPEGRDQSTDKRFACVHQDKTNSVRTIVTDTVDAVVGQTYQVTVTSDGESLRLYVDGTLKDTTARNGAALTFDGAITRIAACRAGATAERAWQGEIYSVALYNRPLLLAETQLFTDDCHALVRLRERVYFASAAPSSSSSSGELESSSSSAPTAPIMASPLLLQSGRYIQGA
jgi:hypothetical protein